MKKGPDFMTPEKRKREKRKLEGGTRKKAAY
jgi:hypothetical protein